MLFILNVSCEMVAFICKGNYYATFTHEITLTATVWQPKTSSAKDLASNRTVL